VNLALAIVKGQVAETRSVFNAMTN
jgi:hypothetical protein